MLQKLKIFTLLIASLMMVASLSACNTMSGVGKDLEAAGDTLTGSAEKNKKY